MYHSTCTAYSSSRPEVDDKARNYMLQPAELDNYLCIICTVVHPSVNYCAGSYNSEFMHMKPHIINLHVSFWAVSLGITSILLAIQ